MKKDSLLKSATLIVICTFISKALGLIRDSITASKFGAGGDLDAFFAASNVPSILFITIGVAITTTIIPLYNEKLKEGKKEAFSFINNVLNFFLITTTVISILCIIFISYIVLILNPGFSGQQLDLTKLLTVILVPTLIFNSIIFIFNGVLQSENNFTVPSLIALPFNFLIIGYLLIYGNRYGVVGLTIITCIATVVQIIPQVIYVYKYGFRYKLTINIKDPMLKRMIIMFIPIILGSGVQQINGFIERAVATKFSSGSLSVLSYAYRIFALFVDIFVVTISTVVYPRMAKQTASNDINKMKGTFSKTIGIIIVFILPLSLLVMIHSKSIVYILFQRGQFTSNDTLITSSVLIFYAMGLLAFGIRDFTCKAYYTLKDTKTPMINSAIAMVINIIFIFIFSKLLGLKGLALASTSSMYIACILLILNLRKKIGGINSKQVIETLIKTGIAASTMSIFVVYLNKIICIKYVSAFEVLAKIMLTSISGLAMFILVAFIIGLKEIKQFKEIFKVIK